MATIFHCTFSDASFPDRGGGPAGTAYDEGLDGYIADGQGLEAFNIEVGSFGQAEYNAGQTIAGESSKVLTAAGRRTGYKGFRWYLGDGANSFSATPQFQWSTTGNTELWFRCYMRMQTGLEWTLGRPGYWKMFRHTNHYIIGFGYPGGGQWGIDVWEHDDGGGDRDVQTGTSLQWSDTQGGSSTGDGQWHCFEWHIKKNTPTNNDGIFQTWLDGVEQANLTTINYNASLADWDSLFIDNQNAIVNGPWYVDMTDIKVSDSGYIGLESGGGSTTSRGSVPMFRMGGLLR